MVYERTNGRVKILHGSSLLRPITRPNTCRAARIPLQWCLCEYPRFVPNDTKAVEPLLAEAFIGEKYNTPSEDSYIRKLNFTELAVTLNEGRRLFLAHLVSEKKEYEMPNEDNPTEILYHEAYFEIETDGRVRMAGSIDNIK